MENLGLIILIILIIILTGVFIITVFIERYHFKKKKISDFNKTQEKLEKNSEEKKKLVVDFKKQISKKNKK